MKRSIFLKCCLGLISLAFSYCAVVVCFTPAPKTSTFLQPHLTPTAKHLQRVQLTELNSGLQAIDCIYVINLERRIENWVRTKQIYEAKGLHPNRLNAVDGKNLSEETRKELVGPYSMNIGPGQMGCILSHISAIKDGYERGFKTIWVLEDDTEIEGDLTQIPQLLTELSVADPQWDIFYTDPDQRATKSLCFKPIHLDPRPDQALEQLGRYLDRSSLTQNIRKTGLRCGTHSMVISRNGMKKILDYFTHAYLWTPYDFDINCVPTIHRYSSEQFIVTQITDGVHDTRPKNFYLNEAPRGFCRTLKQRWIDLDFKKYYQ